MRLVYTNEQKTIVVATLDDGTEFTIPWDPVLNQPLDGDGYVASRWREAASPQPEPYVVVSQQPEIE
jgi:hypothetical protein